jgi:hypothetical protein
MENDMGLCQILSKWYSNYWGALFFDATKSVPGDPLWHAKTPLPGTGTPARNGFGTPPETRGQSDLKVPHDGINEYPMAIKMI